MGIERVVVARILRCSWSRHLHLIVQHGVMACATPMMH